MPRKETEFFAYQWSDAEEKLDDDQSERTIIRIYGVSKTGKNVYVKVTNFTPYCYVELPQTIEWNESRIGMVKSKLCSLGYKRDYQPISSEFSRKKSLYFAEKESSQTVDGKTEYKDKYYPFFRFCFRSKTAMRSFCYNLKNRIEISGLGIMVFKVHETDNISPVLNLLATNKLPSAGWIKSVGELVDDVEKESTFDEEYICSYKDLLPLDTDDTIIQPRVLSFDIEANSTITSAMPNPSEPNDKVFQISCISSIQNKIEKYLMTLGDPDPQIVGSDVIIQKYKTEADLLMGFRNHIHEKNYNVIIGYNILGWDFEYMINRAKFTHIMSGSGSCFSKIGCIQDGRVDTEVSPKFESRAHAAQKLVYLDSEGRLYLDLLPIIKREYKLLNYRLKTVTTHFGLPTKDPLTAQDIFRCYREFTPKSLGEVGKYCVQDAYITLLLYQKLQLWFGLCEMAKTAHVPIFYTFTKGTQIQMFSQVMKYCMYNNYVIVADKYVPKRGEEEYMGATVLTPIPGKYKKVLSFDFASLYPSIMMAYNIDYSTFVNDDIYTIGMYDDEYYLQWNRFPSYVKLNDDKKGEKIWEKVNTTDELIATVKRVRAEYPNRIILLQEKESNIKDEHCHIFEWEDHSGCDHDLNRKKKKNGEYSTAKRKIICGCRYYRFLKAEYSKGVVPILLESLISRRKQTRAEIAKNEKEIRVLLVELLASGCENSDFITSFKSENKKYFENIEDEVESYKSPGFTQQELNNKRERITFLNTINGVFDKRQSSYKICANSMYGAMGVKKGYLPLVPAASTITYRGRSAIEFISTYIPERYGGITVYGDTDSSMIYFPHIKDNGEAVRLADSITADMERYFPKPMKLEFEKVYEKYLILTKKRYMAHVANKKGEIIDFIKKGVVLQRRDNCKFLRDIYLKTTTSLLDDVDTDTILSEVVDGINTLFHRKYNYRDFVITKSMNRAEYLSKTLPAHVQLANRMKRRGMVVGTGSRIEYIFTTKCRGEKDFNQGDKVEDIDYFSQFKSYLRVDYLYYMEKQLIKPLDELLKVGLGIDDFVKNQFQLRLQKYKVNEHILELFSPKLHIIEDENEETIDNEKNSDDEKSDEKIQHAKKKAEKESKPRKPRKTKIPQQLEFTEETTSGWM